MPLKQNRWGFHTVSKCIYKPYKQTTLPKTSDTQTTKVARERFELSSRAPEAPMLDRYTTGLRATLKGSTLFNFNFAPLSRLFSSLTLRVCSSILG